MRPQPRGQARACARMRLELRESIEVVLAGDGAAASEWTAWDRRRKVFAANVGRDLAGHEIAEFLDKFAALLADAHRFYHDMTVTQRRVEALARAVAPHVGLTGHRPAPRPELPAALKLPPSVGTRGRRRPRRRRARLSLCRPVPRT